MKTTDTQELLQAFVRSHSEPAFEELVNRYLGLVYSAALRRVDGQTQLAEEVTQQVFTDLACKAASLPADIPLGGWLHRHTGFVASTLMRSELRRQNRERQAVEMSTLNDPSQADWHEISAVLDKAMDELDASDRDALVLRFFERREFKAVGQALGVSDDTAQKRVSRALERLRGLLASHGVSALSVSALALVLGSRTLMATPAGLGARTVRAALLAASGNAAKTGILLGVLGSAGVKLAAGFLVTATLVGVVLLHSRGAKTVAPLQTASGGSVPNKPAVPSAETSQPTSSVSAPSLQAPTPDPLSSKPLRLVLVSADNNQPVPNVMVKCRSIFKFQRGTAIWTNVFQANRFGACEIPVPSELLDNLDLRTGSEGFADTLMSFPSNQIPAVCTVKLARAVQLGGSVVDADDQPVASARVHLQLDRSPHPDPSQENHRFGSLEISTDARGKWTVARVAPELVCQIQVSASHPTQGSSEIMAISRNRDLERQLREGSLELRLKVWTKLQGIVVNVAGTPVANAIVQLEGTNETRSAVDGSFAFGDCESHGTAFLYAEAEGLGYTAQKVEFNPNLKPVKLVLGQGHVLKVRVVDPDGAPVPEATVMPGRDLKAATPDDNKTTWFCPLSSRTDAEGKLTWTSAAESRVEAEVYAPDRMWREGLQLDANGQEQVITLLPQLVISGTVRDAANGTPISHFEILHGTPNPDPRLKDTDQIDLPQDSNIIWSGNVTRYSQAEFRKTLNHPVLSVDPNPGYVLKFQAEGCMPFTSRLIAADEGGVTLDVTLSKTATPRISVLLPNGSPAIGADVVLYQPGTPLGLIPGGIQRSEGTHPESLLHTDADGRFVLPGEPAITRIIAVHPGGYAEVTPTELTASPMLNLQPWGRLEGNCLVADQPAVGWRLTLQSLDPATNTLRVVSGAFHAAVDEQGHFVFPQVPPGQFRIERLVENATTRPDSQEPRSTLSNAEVTVHPGESITRTIQAGGSQTPGL